MKKVNIDPFRNATEFLIWTEENCDRCVKNSRFNETKNDYTKVRCAVQRDMFTRMICNKPIAQRSIDACGQLICPYLKTKEEQTKQRKNRQRQRQQNQLLLDL